MASIGKFSTYRPIAIYCVFSNNEGSQENRYRMEWTNIYMRIDNVTMHVIEHDIALALDIMLEYKKTGKLSPLLKLKC